ncbi:MAG: radical SAM protein [Infirmifilum sp.]
MDQWARIRPRLKMTLAVIIDGYTDEPAGLGVPPYIDVYPRYIAGAIWHADKSAQIHYFTIDTYRLHEEEISKLISRADLLIVIGGVVVPGRYLGGKPITSREVITLPKKYEKPIKVLAGPIARFGTGEKGGERAVTPRQLEDAYDVVIRGDPALVVHDLVSTKSLEKVNPFRIAGNYNLINVFATIGARIVTQHPNHGFNLTAEIETFRGCSRWLTGGCSFCIEPRFGRVIVRDQEDIAREISLLYELGVRSFRLGRQSDFLAYKANGMNEVEYPEPNPVELRKLFQMIRAAAPSLETLHIDNVNPMTIALHEEKSREALKIIVKYHTPGDVAAFGLESADPRVARENNLGNDPESVIRAIEVVNEVGARRGWNGLPEMLPGLNFVLGLKGETRETFVLNKAFLEELLERNLLVRRINLREVLPLPGTPMWEVGNSIARRHTKYIAGFKRWVREVFDEKMIERVFPRGLIIRRCYVEALVDGRYAARPTGSYPPTVFLDDARVGSRIDCIVYGHKARSLLGVKFPLDISEKTFLQVFGSRGKEYYEKVRSERVSDLPACVLKYLGVMTGRISSVSALAHDQSSLNRQEHP